MTHKQWETTIRSKVYSSWNLHTMLPSTMDFFVLISSLAGVYGSPSQSNYAASNTFINDLARYRATQPDLAPTVSIDLGWMENIGIIAEREEYKRTRERYRDMKPLQAEHLHSVLEHYCDPALPRPTPSQSQILLGLMTPRDSLARGRDPPAHLLAPMFSPFASLPSTSATSSLSTTNDIATEHALLREFHAAPDIPSRADAVAQLLRRKLAVSLCLAPDDIDIARSLTDYGVDSLIAIELRTVIWHSFHVSLAMFEIMSTADIRGLAELIAMKAGEGTEHKPE